MGKNTCLAPTPRISPPLEEAFNMASFIDFYGKDKLHNIKHSNKPPGGGVNQKYFGKKRIKIVLLSLLELLEDKSILRKCIRHNLSSFRIRPHAKSCLTMSPLPLNKLPPD